MGRKNTNAVHTYFYYMETVNKSICLINNCDHEVPGKHATNLLSHLSSAHPDEFTLTMMSNKKRKSEDRKSQIGETKRARCDVITECVNLVTVHGRPFALIKDSAFQNIIKMIPSCSISPVTTVEIRNSVIEKANNLRNDFSRIFQSKLLSLKIDSATCMERSFLAINVQYVDDAKLVLKTLAVKEMFERHTSEYLLQILKNVLQMYNISTEQIYSITTDNGANMIKLVGLLNKEERVQIENETSESDDEENIRVENTEWIYEESTVNLLTQSVRCAAHTLQLAVTDVLKENSVSDTIIEARRICKKLRTPVVRSILKATKKPKAIIDCPTRWHSTLDMLERLLELKSCCQQDNQEHYISPDKWNQINEIVCALVPARVATKKLQQEQLVVGDFYRCWTQCLLDTAKVQNTLAVQLVERMKIRQNKLFCNDAFLCALLLDGRYNVVLSPEQITKAIEHLEIVWVRHKTINEAIGENSDSYINVSISSDTESDVDDVEKMLRNLEAQKAQDIRANLNLTDIAALIKKYLQLRRLLSKDDILLYWEKNKDTMPQLYILAKIALSVPPTQVSVERLFSSLKYILSPLRYNLKDNIIDDILFLRANSLS